MISKSSNDQTTSLSQQELPFEYSPDHDYDINRPQYLYSDNEDGSLFQVGIVRPSDINRFGHIRGPRPASTQTNPGTIQVATINGHVYDTNRPQYLYCHNGDGTLFDVGIARPGDITEYGAIRGAHPSSIQDNPGVIASANSYEFWHHPGYERRQAPTHQSIASSQGHLQSRMQDTTTYENDFTRHPAKGAQNNHV
jgi:hypothetical protein